MNKIYDKLNQARQLVRNTKHKKEGRNTYSKYDYFTPEQVETIVSEVTEKTKMLVLCNLKRNQYGLFQELTLVDLENEGETLSFELATEMGSLTATNETQQMGGTDTYSERYIKMKVFQIKDNNLDFDSQDNTQKPKDKEVKPTISNDKAYDNATFAIDEADSIETLNTLGEQIRKSKILTVEQKAELNKTIYKKLDGFDPTK